MPFIVAIPADDLQAMRDGGVGASRIVTVVIGYSPAAPSPSQPLYLSGLAAGDHEVYPLSGTPLEITVDGSGDPVPWTMSEDGTITAGDPVPTYNQSPSGDISEA